MKKIISSFTFFTFAYLPLVWACDVCKKNQPAGFENITHGAGPSGSLDYLITWSAAILVLITLFLSLKFLIKPQEGNPEHIKNIVLHEKF